MDPQALYIQRIHTVLPNLDIETAYLHMGNGQFNAILIVNDELIFRFPRSQHAASTLVKEVAVLRALQSKTTLLIPNPIYASIDNPEQSFMGYRMLPGEPLYRTVLDSIADEALQDQLAGQIAMFMRELHSISTQLPGLDLPVLDGWSDWQEMYQQFHEHLFPFMRPDACAEVSGNFAAFLEEPRHFAYTPVLRHGDFGGSNILYDAEKQRISGVIDFSFTAYGDAALDAAAISTLGDDLLQRIRKTYPEVDAMRERIQFYKSTYALQQALYALRDGDKESFDDGMAEYV